MDEQLKSNLTSPKHWVRLVYMVLFAFFLYIAAMVMIGLVVVQFLFSLLTGSDNHKLRAFGYTLTMYIQQALLFLSFNSEFKPFPFADWPDEPVTTEPVAPAPEAPVAAGEGHASKASPSAKAQSPDVTQTRTESKVDAPTVEATEAAPAKPVDMPPKNEKPSRTEPDLENRDPPLVDPEAEKKTLS